MLQFRKRIKIVKGVWLNVGKTGVNSLSIGGGLFTLNIGRQGIYITGSLVGTGISARKQLYKPKRKKDEIHS